MQVKVFLISNFFDQIKKKKRKIKKYQNQVEDKNTVYYKVNEKHKNTKKTKQTQTKKTKEKDILLKRKKIIIIVFFWC
jgi:hypothetical protein